MIVQPISPHAATYVARRMREADAREIFATRTDDNPVRLANEAASRGPLAWAAGDGGFPIACIGAQECWPGVWNAWMFATDDFPQIGKALTRFAKRSIIPALAAAAAHRVQCFSMEGHDEAHRWLEDFGAVREFTFPNFGRNREAFHLYRLDVPHGSTV